MHYFYIIIKKMLINDLRALVKSNKKKALVKKISI